MVGVGFTAIIIGHGKLLHPFAVPITVNVEVETGETVMELVVAALLHV